MTREDEIISDIGCNGIILKCQIDESLYRKLRKFT